MTSQEWKFNAKVIASKPERECLVSFDNGSIFIEESFKAQMIGVDIFE